MRAVDLETLRGFYESFAKGDFSSAAAAYAPDVEWVETRGVPGQGRFRGLGELKEGFRGWLKTWENYSPEAEQLIDAGDHAVAVVTGHGRGRLSGAEASERFFQVWTMRDGEVVRIENHRELEEALAAAGLPPAAAERFDRLAT